MYADWLFHESRVGAVATFVNKHHYPVTMFWVSGPNLHQRVMLDSLERDGPAL